MNLQLATEEYTSSVANIVEFKPSCPIPRTECGDSFIFDDSGKAESF